jgi:ribosomal-protein-alanine N-acetyltransferase
MDSTLISLPGSPALIEPATWRDFNALRQLEKACFPQDAWPIFDLVGVLAFGNVVRLKAMVNGGMVGFIAGDIRGEQRMAWIATIGVLPEYRGRGIGRALLAACEKQLAGVPSVRLNVRTSNKAAIGLYQSCGYERVGLWPTYYQDGEDALVMEKRL